MWLSYVSAGAAVGAVVVALFALYWAIRSAQASEDSAKAARGALEQAERQADAAMGNVPPYVDIVQNPKSVPVLGVRFHNPNTRQMYILSVTVRCRDQYYVWWQRGDKHALFKKISTDTSKLTLASPHTAQGGSVEKPYVVQYPLMLAVTDKEPPFIQPPGEQVGTFEAFVEIEYRMAGTDSVKTASQKFTVRETP